MEGDHNAADGPPSIKRSDPLGWLLASGVSGAALGLVALVALWRPLPGLPAPPGALSSHLLDWAAMLWRALVPTAFPGQAQAHAAFWAGLDPSGRAAILWRDAVAGAIACAPFPLLAKSFLTPRDRLIELRGARRHEGNAAAPALRRRLATRAKANPDHEIAPGIAYPSGDWTRHCLIVGGVGSGKSTCLRGLIDQVARSGEQMLLFDAKGEFTAHWTGPSLIAPWDERGLAWDIARDVRNAMEMERFAASVIQESGDPMWSSASRQILVGLMLRLRATRHEAWGWAELRDSLCMPQPEMLDAMERFHPIAARSLAKATVTSAGIMINMMAFCAPIFHLASAWGGHPPERRISVREWALGRSMHRQLILQGHGAYSELARAVAEGVLGVFASLVASVEMPDDSGRRIWLIADECAELGAFPMELLALGRSRGLRCVMATQDIAQLREIHGENAAKALVSMVGTLIVGQTMPGESSKLLCEAFGTREVERPNVSAPIGGPAGKGSTLSYSREEVALYKPSELARLGLSADGKSVRLVLFAGGDAYELSWPIFPMRQARSAHVPARWISDLHGGGGDADADAGQGAAGAPSGGAAIQAIDALRGSSGEAERPLPAGDASERDEPNPSMH